MALDLAHDCLFHGPALPAPFVQNELERELTRAGLLPRAAGADGKALQESWDGYRRRLRELAVRAGAVRVRNHVVEPLVERLGYARLAAADDVETREGRERGGDVMVSADGAARLRVWCTELDEDLDAPARRGAAFRYSHLRIAQRVLLAAGERIGLLTNGTELRVLLSDPARPDSQIEIAVDPAWKRRRDVPDSYRLLLALASPAGVRAAPDLIEKARLMQARVTRDLRKQARQAVERFVQEVLDHPDNRPALAAQVDRSALARDLWREGLVTVYRLLFVLKLEASDDPARVFSFASTSLWRRTFSPSVALARYARAVLDGGATTGRLLEDGLRSLFRMFADGLQCSELTVKPLGGALFGAGATPRLSGLRWGERAVAHLLDRLLWTDARGGGRERVHYGPLDVEDLGRVYETLLELEPGIAAEPMCRLRRQKLEVVVPLAQGEKYRPAAGRQPGADDVEAEDGDDGEADDDDAPAARGTRVEWIEAIAPGQFYLRVGLGRKATGSYYTPHSFVRFLVQETLGPQATERSPEADPNPEAILALKVLDPAMGSGHFLVEACRFLGRHLYEACRLCDERALAAERRAETAPSASAREAALGEAARWRERLAAVPDPDQELVKYLPSRAPEGQESGYSQRKAEALCRRLVAVHCLYGVDKNPLAVELAKLALWIEAHAEGFPLTFLDHRLIGGDSLTGPFFEHLLTYPGSQDAMDDLFTRGMRETFPAALGEALKHVAELEASTGITLADIEAKQAAKARLDRALAPFRVVAAAWAGGVMLGPEACDDQAYARLLQHVGEHRELPAVIDADSHLSRMVARGLGVEALPASPAEILALVGSSPSIPALPYDLAFAEVFFPLGMLTSRRGFDAVLGNPPWDRMLPADKEFFAPYDFSVLDTPTQRERAAFAERLLADPAVSAAHESYIESFRSGERITERLYTHQIAVVNGERTIGKQDAFRLFMERKAALLAAEGSVGVVVPSAFHANEGATGIRRLYFEQLAIRCCYSFENRRRLFEIHRSFKFALVVASRQGPTSEFACAFYLHDDEWLFTEGGHEKLAYTLDFVRQTGGQYLSLLELRAATDLEVVHICFGQGEPFGRVCDRFGIHLGRELNMTDDAWRFTPVAEVLPRGEDPRDPGIAWRLLDRGYLVLHEGKTLRQYDDHWGDRPRYVVSCEQLADRKVILRRTRFFRLGHRHIAGPGDQNVSIFSLLPPGITTGNTAPLEHRPDQRPNSASLLLLAALNTFPFDWLLQLRVRSHLNQFMLLGTPLPRTTTEHPPTRRFLAHGALRLTCNHAGYAPLWGEQVGDVWREPGAAGAWPILATDDQRWAIRAAIDAVVADGYGLSRGQYAHVLSTFSHRSYPRAPEWCLQRFDELRAIGVDAFAKTHDPYWDIPLKENPPQPVIELPISATAIGGKPQGELYPVDLQDIPVAKAAEEARAYSARRNDAGQERKRRGSRRRGR